jgi:5-methylcytosine-specific restriction endonuclease McrA
VNDYYKNCAFPKPISKKHKRAIVSQETYNKVFNACNGSCVLCKTTKNLELHHILGRGKDLTDNPKNCVMLCNNCHHNIVHGNLKKYRPILMEICKGLYGNEV